MMNRRLQRAAIFAWPAVIVALFALALPVAAQSGPLRTTLDLDGIWSLDYGAGPVNVSVPGQIPFTFGVSHWTRKFNLNLAQRPLVAYLHFAGIVNTASVTLNGVHIGTLIAFEDTTLDVAAALNWSGSNTLQLDIDDRLLNDTVPGGPTDTLVPTYGRIAYTFPIPWANKPGIIRPVSLVYSSRPVIAAVFATPTFNADLSTANLSFRVRVNGSANTVALVAVTLNGVYRAGCKATASATPGELACSTSLASPQLWSPNSPVLHDLWVQLYDIGGITDTYIDRIGLRKIEARGTRFYLNNQPLFLRGMCRHDLYPALNFQADDVTIESDLRWIKQLGVNYVRSIHYPPDARIARRADEIGLLLSEEIPAWAAFENPNVIPIAKQHERLLIERDYNRASVIFWLTGNGRPGSGIDFLTQTTQYAKQLDPTRLTAFVWDNNVFNSTGIGSNLSMTRTAGMDFYAQSSYYWPGIISTAIAAMPLDMPYLAAEWAGSEGDDRGPLGAVPSGATTITSFPDYPIAGNGTPEYMEALTMLERGTAWLPYVCTSTSTAQCAAGLVYFNWQDIEWPGMPYFYSGHFGFDRNGLVYEDRTPKVWPIATFQAIMNSLP